MVERSTTATDRVDRLETGWTHRHFSIPAKPRSTKTLTLPRRGSRFESRFPLSLNLTEIDPWQRPHKGQLRHALMALPTQPFIRLPPRFHQAEAIGAGIANESGEHARRIRMHSGQHGRRSDLQVRCCEAKSCRIESCTQNPRD
jgi:hypothetical protein